MNLLLFTEFRSARICVNLILSILGQNKKFFTMKKLLLCSIALVGMSLMDAQNATDLPYSYGFETPGLDGWTVFNAGTGNNWEVAQASSETPDPSEGENYMLYYFHENAANSYLFSRGLNLKAGQTINLKFDYMGTAEFFPEKMEVLVGTSPSVAAMTQQIWIDEEIINYPYQTASVYFTVPSDGVYYIAFRAFSDPDQFYLSLDNIKIEQSLLSTSDAKSSALSFYPNPAKNILNVDHAKEVTDITVYELSGKNVLNAKPNTKNVKLDVSKLAKGVYMMRVATKDGAKTVKVIKD